jgi:hypothetical protein
MDPSSTAAGNVNSAAKSALLAEPMAEQDKPSRNTSPQWQPPAAATGTLPPGASQAPADRTVSRQIGLAPTLQADDGLGGPSVPPPDAPAPLSVGDVVGSRYVIEEHVSSGGFGAVYRASDREIPSHHVALKILHTPAADDTAREAALRELTLIASVSHPSVVQFKDYGWRDGRLWFAMPWMQGETLDQRFAGVPLERAEARPIFERLAMGLSAMHEVGIEHHDVKPENVYLAQIAGFEGGLPVLLDLGIAAEKGEGPKGMTLDYCAPETARRALGEEGVEVGAAADVFSLALVLRNMLDPPEAPDADVVPLAALHKRATEPEPPPARKDLRYLAPHFERWLSLDPDERPTAAEFSRELRVLTEPEELRAARVRLLKRIIPVVLLSAVAVAWLWYEVQRQEEQLTVQKEQLSAKAQETAVLRQQSEGQLQQLETQMEELGSQRRELTRAIRIARQLDQQLERTEEKREQLSRQARALGNERDALRRQRDTLQQARDALEQEQARLQAAYDRTTQQRDELTVERNALRLERTQLERERDRLQQQVSALETERGLLGERLAAVERARDSLQKSQRGLEQQLLDLHDKAKTQAARIDALESDTERLQTEKRKLEAENRKLKAAARVKPQTSGPADQPWR